MPNSYLGQTFISDEYFKNNLMFTSFHKKDAIVNSIVFNSLYLIAQMFSLFNNCSLGLDLVIQKITIHNAVIKILIYRLNKST